MITETKGNILEAPCSAIVNTVNCVGVMGKGIALQFKKAYPENYRKYKKLCDNGEVQIGRMLVFDTNRSLGPRFIINFPTKKHWRGKSHLSFIESGLNDLIQVVRELKIESIAIPPLGAGLGGLYWPTVKTLILKAFADAPEVSVLLYEPAGSPAVDKQPVKADTQVPMTRGRALLLALMNLYQESGYRHSQLEVQKIMYFMKESGEPIERLTFEKYHYGPYSDGLRHALQKMEGYYIRGCGDGTGPSQIVVLEGALKKAEEFLKNLKKSSVTLARLNQIKELIDGFETPYGLELLATVHWSVVHDKIEDLNEVIQSIHSWNGRKKELMKESHIESAYKHLRDLGWLKAS